MGQVDFIVFDIFLAENIKFSIKILTKKSDLRYFWLKITYF